VTVAIERAVLEVNCVQIDFSCWEFSLLVLDVMIGIGYEFPRQVSIHGIEKSPCWVLRIDMVRLVPTAMPSFWLVVLPGQAHFPNMSE